jgi:hypothetical protein
MYERRHTRPMPTGRFLRRLAAHVAVASGLVVVSLILGMAGYEGFEQLAWGDAFTASRPSQPASTCTSRSRWT